MNGAQSRRRATSPHLYKHISDSGFLCDLPLAASPGGCSLILQSLQLPFILNIEHGYNWLVKLRAMEYYDGCLYLNRGERSVLRQTWPSAPASVEAQYASLVHDTYAARLAGVLRGIEKVID